MTEQEKFDRAIAVLVKAFFNKTLTFGSCTRCAVGNLIGALAYPGSVDGTGKAKGLSFHLPDGSNKFTAWFYYTKYGRDGWKYATELDRIEAEEQRAALGYTWEQIAKIESVFEDSRKNKYDRDDVNDVFDGMLAVVSQLAIFHNIDLSHILKAQELFNSSLPA